MFLCIVNNIVAYNSNGYMTKYTYSPTGEKLRVTHQTAVPNITVPIGSTRELAPYEIQYTDSTDYLLGGCLTLRNGRIDKLLFEEGYCQAESYVYNSSQDVFTFCYYDRDHLGNIRQVTEADGTSTGNVIQTMNYYPFGAEFCDGSANSSVQSHKYNGKEFDGMHGLNMYDFGARWYDVAGVPMWTSIDPLCEKYYNVSPYVYCQNNPVKNIDLYGLFSFENINSNTSYNVVFVLPNGYCDVYGDSQGKVFDLVRNNLGTAPIIYVDDIEDFANAMSELNGRNVQIFSYDINSHGKFNQFRIGSQVVTTGTDVSILKSGLKGKDVFIDACQVSIEESANGINDLTAEFAYQTQSNTITSCHPISGRTRYDGLEPFNQEVKVPLQIPNSYNKFVISIAGEHSSLIKNVRVSVNDGITWDWELPLNLDTYWFYQLRETWGRF